MATSTRPAYEPVEILSPPTGRPLTDWDPDAHASSGPETKGCPRALLLGYISLAICVLVYSTLGPDLNLIVDVTPVTKTFWRATAAAIAFGCANAGARLLAYAARSCAAPKPVGRHLSGSAKEGPEPGVSLCPALLYAVGSGFAFSVWAGLYVLSLYYTTPGNATLFGNAQGLLLVVGRLCMCKPVSLMELLGCLAAVVGGFIVTRDHHSKGDSTGPAPSLFGNMLGIASSAGAVVYILLAQKALGRLGTLRFMLIVQTCTALNMLILALAVGEMDGTSFSDPFNFHNGVFGWMIPEVDRLYANLYIGFVVGMLAMGTYAYALNTISGAVVGGSQLLTPIFTSMMAVALHQSTAPGLLTYVGAPLLIGGLVVVIWGEVVREALEGEKGFRNAPSYLRLLCGSSVRAWRSNGVLGGRASKAAPGPGLDVASDYHRLSGPNVPA